MDDPSENSLKSICCTCLSTDRLLYQLSKIKDGINNLYLLLSQDPDAFMEGFFKDARSLRVCWECSSRIRRITTFQAQACHTQRLLTDIVERQHLPDLKSLSRLKTHTNTTFDITIVYDDENEDHFIDCGLAVNDIKSEYDSDTPLVEYQDDKRNLNDDDDTETEFKVTYESFYVSKQPSNIVNDLEYENIQTPLKKENSPKPEKKRKIKKKTKLKRDNELYSIETMSEKEMQDFRTNLKSVEYLDWPHKCEYCIEMFQNELQLKYHNVQFHIEEPNHFKCDICSSHIETTLFHGHHLEHYQRYRCNNCQFSSCLLKDIQTHVESCAKIGNDKNTKKYVKKKSTKRKSESFIENGYPCPECDKTFNKRNQRWKHIQKTHKEGYKCSQCDKKFAFTSALARHEAIHNSKFPREECPTCKKSVRCDLMKIHMRTHSTRERYSCAPCARWFVSKASYHHHLHYTSVHAQHDVFKYKCEHCGKGYRSRGELRDHMNFQHLGNSQHKCPVCGKSLATPRCVTRHLKVIHEGIKDSPRDKIMCQQCGKTFRDNKSLLEHMNTHLKATVCTTTSTKQAK